MYLGKWSRTDRNFDANIKSTPTGCWEWVGARQQPSGYGKYGPAYAHRFAWERVNGSIPNGLDVLHRCDNPSCVNLAHLFLGDARANGRDMVLKGRAGYQRYPEKMPRGELHGNAKLTEEAVRVIKTSSERAPILAVLFGVSISAIVCVRRERTWKHVKIEAA